MATFIPVLNGLEVGLHFTDVNNDDEVNVFWVKRSAPWTGALITTMLDAFITWFGTGDGTHSYQKLISLTISLSKVTGRDYTTQNGLSLVSQYTLPLAGTDANDMIAAGTTKAVTHRTGLAGKSYRGRTFLCGITDGAVPDPDLGVIQGSYMTNVVNAFEPLIAAVTAADAEAVLAVVSRYGGVPTVGGKSVPRATGISNPVTSFGYSDLNIDFQRRRAPGHSRLR
jgi:hypothetical protein